MNIVLASTSPRRRELLSWLNIKYTSVAPEVDEEKIRDQNPERLAMLLAEAKAEAIAKTLQQGIVIGSDTVIEFEDKIIEKAKDKKHQKQLIYAVMGKTTRVISGVCLIDSTTNKRLTKTKSTTLYTARVPDGLVDRYIESGQGLDKGGGFGIQDENGLFIERIEGCYTNCIGFPLCIVLDMLKAFGVAIKVDARQEVKKRAGYDC